MGSGDSGGGGGGGSAVSLIGTGLQAYGAWKQGKDTAWANKYNAQVARQEGYMAQQSAQMQKYQIGRQKGKMAGRQHALYAKSGVVTTSGSPFEVMVDTAGQYELDKAIVQYNADVMSARANAEAAYRDKMAKNAYSGGLAQAGSILLSGFAKG